MARRVAALHPGTEHLTMRMPGNTLLDRRASARPALLATPLTLLAGLVLASPAHAGVYLESTDQQLGGTDKPSTSKMWFDGGRMRTERLDADGDTQVVLFKDQALYMLEPKSKSYRRVDKATAQRLGGQIAEARKKMDERMAALPPNSARRCRR